MRLAVVKGSILLSFFMSANMIMLSLSGENSKRIDALLSLFA